MGIKMAYVETKGWKGKEKKKQWKEEREMAELEF